MVWLKIFTPSNLLSLSRLFALPWILFFLFEGSTSQALILMIFCVITDGLDGLVARKMGLVSDLGKILDHLTDKILTVTIILSLVPLRNFPLWAAGLIFFRDLVILLGSFLLFRSRKIIPTSTPLGKLTGISYSLMVVAYLLQWDPYSKIFTLTSSLFVFLSGFHYLYRYFRVFRASHEVAEI